MTIGDRYRRVYEYVGDMHAGASFAIVMNSDVLLVIHKTEVDPGNEWAVVLFSGGIGWIPLSSTDKTIEVLP